MIKKSFALLRTFVLAAFVPALAFSLVACEPESGDEGTTPDVTPEVSVPDGYVNYFIEALSFSRSAGEAKVAFEINVDWSMETVGGDGWRMPTLDEIKELLDDCSWRWTSQNGVNGYKVTGPSGNSIFLPAAGDCFGTEVVNRGSYGDYWSGSLYEYRSLACSLSFGSGNHDWSYYDWSYYYRYYGHPVRPVTE